MGVIKALLLLLFLSGVGAASDCTNVFGNVAYYMSIVDDLPHVEEWIKGSIAAKSDKELEQFVALYIQAWNVSKAGHLPDCVGLKKNKDLLDKLIQHEQKGLEVLKGLKGLEELDLAGIKAKIQNYQDAFWNYTLLQEFKNRGKGG